MSSLGEVQQQRQAQYKKRGDRKMDQIERRKKMLQDQKQRRYDYLQHIRMIAEAVEPEMEASTQDQAQAMEYQSGGQKRRGHSRKGWKHKLMENQLMMSEWVTSVPDDFESEWMLVPCPKGKRSLVIASGGTTTSYSKSGHVINNFPSHLPGGNGRFVQRGKDFTILDCIVSEPQKTYYIMDMMCWKDHPIYDSETEFRFYWLHTKMQECSMCATRSKSNPYRFIPLPNYSCNLNNITAVMATPVEYEIDGLLFYHKRSHYTFGSTPLVLWLKPFMLPDLMGIPVPDIYIQQTPTNYRGFQNFMEEVQRSKEVNQDLKEKGLSNVSKKKQKNNFLSGGMLNSSASSMDTATAAEEPTASTAGSEEFMDMAAATSMQ